MEKILKKILLVTILLLFCFLGIISLVEAKKKDSIKTLISTPNNDIVDNIPIKVKNILLFPRYCWNKLLHKKFYFEDSVYITEDKNIIYGTFNEADISFSINNIKILNDYAKKNKINFLYVIFPGKPLYDEELTSKNISCYSNKTVDNFILELKKNNIPYLDLRNHYRNSKENPYEWFYKTDHHWNSDAGLEAARLITEELNKNYKTKLNSENLKTTNFNRKIYKNYWIGESGKKIYGSTLEKEDFIVNIPKYKTQLSVENKTNKTKKDGDFTILLNEKLLDEYEMFGDNSLYYYYFYPNKYTIDIKNYENKNGDIFYIKDSYSNVVIPFLTLATSNITAWDIRSGDSMYSYLNSHNQYDTIIVAYTTTTIPNHDMNDFK